MKPVFVLIEPNFVSKKKKRGQSDRTVDRVPDLHVANPRSTLGTPYSSPSTTRSDL